MGLTKKSGSILSLLLEGGELMILLFWSPLFYNLMRGGEMEMTPPFCFLFTPNINYNAL
jgi:hypothetical protein